MKIRYSKETDALYIRLNEREIDSSDEIAEGVIVDFDSKGEIVAIEILNVSKHADISKILVESFQKVEIVE